MNAPTTSITTARAARARLAEPERAEFSKRYFKTGNGEYGEGDRFRGLNAAAMRQVARAADGISLGETLKLLTSPYHDDRLIALLILGRAYSRGDRETRLHIVDAYLRHTTYITSWDLVDASAPYILRAFLDALAAVMPRTMLRYSLEHFAPDERATYLAMRSKDGTVPRRMRRRQ